MISLCLCARNGPAMAGWLCRHSVQNEVAGCPELGKPALRELKASEFKAKEWWKTLAAKLRGHFQYYGISGNSAKIVEFYRMTTKLVHKWFNRRSQKGKMNWDEFTEYLKHYPLPIPRIVHKFTLSGVR